VCETYAFLCIQYRHQPVDIFSSVYLSICLFAYLSSCLAVFLYICVFVYVSNCQSVYPSICLFVYLSICLSVYLSICLFVYLSICLSVYLSIFRSVYLFIIYLSEWITEIFIHMLSFTNSAFIVSISEHKHLKI